MNNKKLKTLLAQLSISVLLLGQVTPVVALTAPTAPTAPEAPESPEAPEAPESPEAPEAPESPTSPVQDPVEEPQPPQEEPSNPIEDSQPEPASDPDPSPAPTEGSQDTSNTDNEVVDSAGGQSSSGEVGDVEIDTGDATTTAVGVTNANTNLSLDDTDGLPTISVDNSGNGTDSDNSATVSTEHDSLTIQDNVAIVTNNLKADTTTGDNDASRNVGNSEINTGNANTTGTLINSVNTNIDGVSVYEFNIADDHIGDYVLDFSSDNCISGCVGDYDVSNTGNGSDSQNTSLVDVGSSDVSFQNNDATLENYMVLSSDSGNNTADNNTGGDSDINTGDANIAANVMNFANNNISGDVIYSVVNIFGDMVGDILFPEEVLNTDVANTGNGSDSTNTASANIDNSDETYQYNNANIQNNLLADTNTGDNSTSSNTGGNNSIETGDTSTDVSVINIANTNIVGDMWLVLVNTAGEWLGQIMGTDANGNIAVSQGLAFNVDENGEISVTNADNGSGSTNTGTVNQQTNTTTVQNNTANIVNDLDLSANTGGNSASRNTGGDNSIETGDANIIANIVNFVNNNISGGGRLFVNVVNVFGSWIGDFVMPGSESESENIAQNDQSPAIGGTSLPNTNNSNGSSQSDSASNTQEEPLDEAIFTPTAAPTIIAARKTGSSIVGGAVAGIAQTSADEVIEDITQAITGTIVEPSTKTKINLAWLILLAPPAVLGLFIRRRFA